MADRTQHPTPFLQPWHFHVPPQDDGPQTMEERYRNLTPAGWGRD